MSCARDNRLRAFANSCRHRGSRLLRGRGSCKRIIYPYHSWSYQLDGELSGVPGMQEALDFDTRDYPLLDS
ncbi:MAG: Rieske 2Fe-2S domain-containing protein [Gammaproteobacteria bacterium]|nr:Rieske 2Fe-2S domain-containing protein [Gammaproteobacteria bacterium]